MISAGAARLRVIIVDDSPDDRAEARRLLLLGSTRRYEMVEATSGAAGVKAILDATRGAPDCVILDYHLPDADAIEVLAELTDPHGDVVCPVVVVTGSGGRTVGRDVLRAGAQDFIGKSWMTAESLTRAVDNAIERWTMAVELRTTNARLRQSTRELQTLADNTPDILVRFDRDLRCVFVNAALEAASGRPRSDYLGKTIREMVPGDRAGWDAALEAVLRTGQPMSIEFDFPAPDGVRHYASRIVPELDAAGEVELILAVSHDVTAPRKASAVVREALEKAQEAVRTRDELVALVSHDLKSPLGAVALGVTLLEDEVGGEGRAILEKIARQTARMSKIIDELLDAGQLNAGMPLALAVQEIDLVALVRVIAAEHQDAAPAHRLEIQAAAASLMGRWDPKRIDRVVNNLLSNAVKYSPRGGRVLVEIESESGGVGDGVDGVDGGDSWAILRVTDEGIGMGAEDQARIFKWFARGANALETRIEGTGIGLAGARDIVEQHGGSIAVESEEGRGSTFIVKLPIKPR